MSQRSLTTLVPSFRFICALVAGLGALLIGEHVYVSEFITADENSYVFQAWIFLQGKLSLAAPAGIESLAHNMIINDEKVGWFSRYPPAHAVWIMPGVAINYPRLMIAVAAFIFVWFLTKTGNKLHIPTWITVGLLFISPFFWLMQGSVLSHTSGLAATTIMLWAYLSWLDSRKANFLVVAGLAWAFLFLNRTFTAALIAIPFAIYSITDLVKNRTLKNFLDSTIFAACALVGILVFFLYNYATVGDPFMPTYLYYNPLDNLGFGVRHGPNLAHTIEKGWLIVNANIATLNSRLWGFSGSLVVWAGLVVMGWHSRGISLLMLGCTLMVWFGYVFFWFPGISEVAPVYYYETLVFVILLAGLGLNRLLTMDWTLAKSGKALVIGISAIFVFQASIRTFYTHAQGIKDRNQGKADYRAMIEAVPPNSIVFLSGIPRLIRQEITWNPHGLQSDPLIVQADHGSLHFVKHYYPSRNLYHIHGSPPGPAQLIEDTDDGIPILPANKMRARTGSIDENDRRIAKSPDDNKGLLGHGIKQFFMPGTYEITYTLKADGYQTDKIGMVDVIATRSGEKLASKILKPGDTTVVLEVNVDDVMLVEPRVYFLGQGELQLDRIEMRLMNRS